MPSGSPRAVIPAAPRFPVDIALRARRPEVLDLQRFLNENPTTRVSVTGPGSPGQETDVLGPKTEIALRKYQAAHNLVPTGRVDAPTRVLLNQQIPGIVPSPASTQAPSPDFTKDLSRTARDLDVKRLQQFLNKNPNTRVAVSGPGSLGEETDWFGVLTEAALEKFQIANRLLPTKKLDAATRAVINQLQGSSASVPSPAPQPVPPPAGGPPPSPVPAPLMSADAIRAQIEEIQRRIEELRRSIPR